MWQVLAAAQPWLVPALAWAGAGAVRALVAAWWALRLGIYAVLVWVAWGAPGGRLRMHSV